MSAATASYGLYALAEPRHLGRLMTQDAKRQGDWDVVAHTYAGRDLPLCALGVFGRSDRTVTTAMVLRIAYDIADGLVLSARAEDEETRNKALGVTLGWATLNTLALWRDRRAARLARRP